MRVVADLGSLRQAASWDVTPRATSYRLSWRRVQQDFLPKDWLTTSALAAPFTLSGHGEWVVRLEACNEIGCSLGAIQITSTRPSRPANLSVSTSPGKLKLTATWDAAQGATSHLVKWRSLNGNFQAGGQVTTTKTTADFNVSEYGDWVVRVEGCNDAGCGRGVNQVVSTGPAPPPGKPARPASLSVDFTPGKLAMSATWGSAQGATSYLLRWRRHRESFLSGNQTTTTETTVPFAVPDHGDWVVRVEGCNESGCGPGLLREVTTRPGAPTNLFVISKPGTFDLTATWDAAPGATSYVLAWGRPGKGFPLDNRIDAVETSADITVTDYGTWYVRVKGCNEAGCGPQIRFAQAVWLSVCDRTPQVREELVRKVGKACGEMTPQDLAQVQPLWLHNKGITKLKAGDFQGLTRLWNLKLDGNQLTALPKDLFHGLPILYSIDLGGNRLTEVPEDLFHGLSNLTVVQLDGNLLTTLPEDLFDNSPNIQRLDLDENLLTTLPEDLFDGLLSLDVIFLNFNRLADLPPGLFDDLPSLRSLYLDNNPGAPFTLNLPGVRVYQ